MTVRRKGYDLRQDGLRHEVDTVWLELMVSERPVD